MNEERHPPVRWKVVLVVVPAFLLVGTIGAVWWKIREGQSEVPDVRLAMAAEDVSARELRDHYTKLSALVGRREWVSVEGRRAMRRVVAFIDGTLSPQNYGFDVRRGAAKTAADELWPSLWIDIRTADREEGAVLVATPYDRGDLGVAALLAIANDLRDDELAAGVRFAFYPGDLLERDPAGSVFTGTGEKLRMILCVNSFSSADASLWISDGVRAGTDWALGPEGRLEMGGASGENPAVSGDIGREQAIFSPLGAPVYVCRGAPGLPGESDEPFRDGPSTGDPVDPLLFGKFVDRTVALRNLIRGLGKAEAKRP